MKVKLLSHFQLFATPWTVTYQDPLSMGFSRQEYWRWVAISFSRRSSQPRDRTRLSCKKYITPLLTLARGAFSVPLLMSMPEAFSVPFLILIKLCYTKALE